MSGTIPLSMTQQFDVYGQPLSGGQLTIIQAGTVATPQNPYQDAALSLLMPNPITLDAAGRIPQFFLADGYIKIRLADKYGVTQLAADGILVIGPSAGGGGGGGVDPTTIWQTGDIKARYDTAVVAGFVRANARTIGSAVSGATELADSSAQALFNYLWAKDTSLVVLPSRGASAAADWSANRQITLPDWRGRAIGALDDMGNTAAGRLTAPYFGATPTVLGAAGGTQTHTLSLTELPTGITAGGPASVGTNTRIIASPTGTLSTQPSPSTGGGIVPTSTASWTGFLDSFTGSASVTSNNTGGVQHSIVPPLMLTTIYIKL